MYVLYNLSQICSMLLWNMMLWKFLNCSNPFITSRIFDLQFQILEKEFFKRSVYMERSSKVLICYSFNRSEWKNFNYVSFRLMKKFSLSMPSSKISKNPQSDYFSFMALCKSFTINVFLSMTRTSTSSSQKNFSSISFMITGRQTILNRI